MTRRTLTLPVAFLLAVGCGFGSSDEEPAPAPPPPPPTLTLGAPTQVTVAAVAEGVDAESAAPPIRFTVPQAGRYQCTAHAQNGATALDAQMRILSNGQQLARDSDSGEGYDARITTELAPGTYDIRVSEWRRRAGLISVTCILAPSAPPAPAAIALGVPVTFAVVAGQGPGTQPELALTITTPGNIQCDAHAQDGATARDAQLALVQNGVVLQQDSDSGEGTDARLTRTLAPGLYHVRVWEWMHRAAALTVRCAPASAPAPTVAAGTPLTLGTPAAVAVPAGEGPAGQVALPLTITAPGRYQCDAHSGEHDAQMAIDQNGVELQQDSDSGEGRDSRIVRDLTPGTYQVRVWEWLHRATTVTVRCAPAG